jgi:hypothetical protein
MKTMKTTKNLLLIILFGLAFTLRKGSDVPDLAAGQSMRPATTVPPKGPSNGSYQRLFDGVGDRCYPGLVSLAAVAGTANPNPQRGGNGSGSAGALPQNHQATSFLPTATPASGSTHRRAVSAVDDLALLADIEMAKFQDGELIVIGPAATGGNGIRPDDWYVVFRAIAGAEAPGVSIDPGPNPNVMQVRYFGGIQASDLGRTFFEADRTLKLMSTGFDNYSCALWPGRPHGIPTELDLVSGERTNGGESRGGSQGWHRFWFEPSANPIETEGFAMRIPKNRLMVKDEPVPPGSPSPKSAREFAANMTKDFLALTGQVPAFRELQSDAALVALAKWIRDKHVPVDDDWIKSAPNSTSAPGTTPSITVVRATITDRAYLSFGIHGGVDFQRDNRYGATSAQMRRLGSAANTSRPATKSSWAFNFDGQPYRAFGLRVRKAAEVTPRWVAWRPDTSKNLAQPTFYSELVPNGNFAVKNGGPEEVTIQLTGSLNLNQRVAPNSIATVRVVPGAYKMRIVSPCGTKDYALNVAEGERHEVEYFCGPQTTGAPSVPAIGAFEVNNKTGAGIIVKVAGASHNVPPGSHTIQLSPGSYDATISSRCGTATEHLSVTNGSTHSGEYSCGSR